MVIIDINLFKKLEFEQFHIKQKQEIWDKFLQSEIILCDYVGKIDGRE